MYVGRSYSAGQGQGPWALGVEFNEVINEADARTQVPIQSPGGDTRAPWAGPFPGTEKTFLVPTPELVMAHCPWNPELHLNQNFPITKFLPLSPRILS